MSKDEASGAGIELSIAGVFKLKLPPAITQALFGSSAATAEKLQRLSAGATEKIAAGVTPNPDEQLAHELVMAPLRRKAARLAPAAARAAEILEREPKLLPSYVEGQQPPPQTPPAEDWTDRWVEGASTTDQPDVREMWARILAGEVAKPGSFSFKTLSVLKDIDQETAQAFVRLLPLVLNNKAVPVLNELEEHYTAVGLDYPMFLRFDELGLLNFPAVSSLKETAPPEPLVLEGLGYAFALPGRTGQVGVHTLTQAGREIASIADKKATRAAILAKAAWLQSRHPKVQFGIFLGPEQVQVKDWSPDLLAFDDATGTVGFAP